MSQRRSSKKKPMPSSRSGVAVKSSPGPRQKLAVLGSGNKISDADQFKHSRHFERKIPESSFISSSWMAAVGFVSVLFTIVAFFIPDITLYAKVFIGLLFVTAISYIHLRYRKTLMHVAIIVVIVITWIIAFKIHQPSEIRVKVDSLMAQTKDANIWVARDPIMFASSVDYLVNNFDSFDPNKWHEWNELKEIEAAPFSDLIVQAGAYAGNGVVTLAQVKFAQPFGDEWIVQLGPVSQETGNSEKTIQITESSVGKSDAITLLSGAVAEPESSRMTIYCRITLAPFVQLEQGETVLLKGVPIAYGRTQRQDGTESDLSYMACSSILRFYDSRRHVYQNDFQS